MSGDNSIKKLTRSKSDRMIGGVCGGFGEYLGVDSTLIRLLWAFIGLAGVGLLAYIICLFVVPEEDLGE